MISVGWSLFLMLNLFGGYTYVRFIEKATLSNCVRISFGVFGVVLYFTRRSTRSGPLE